MSEFCVGDRVVLRPMEELDNPHWKEQEVGIGIITELRSNKDWCTVRWEDKEKYGYRYKGSIIDLIKVKETNMRTLPTKEQVLQAAKRCSQIKNALAILFPDDFGNPVTSFPDDCTYYGVFVLGTNLYIRQSLYDMGILKGKEYSPFSPAPPGYKCAEYATRNMQILPDLRSVPLWIRTHDYGEIT